MRLRYDSGYYPSVRMAIPVPEVGYPRLTAPFATFPQGCPQVLVRLACLIHAANVRSEPGSNPSKIYFNPLPTVRLGETEPLKSLMIALRHDSKNCSAMTCIIASSRCVTP